MKLSKILGKKIDFFQLLEEQSEYIIASADALKSYVETLEPESALKVKALEKEADNKRGELGTR